jgi:hypothetical protein
MKARSLSGRWDLPLGCVMWLNQAGYSQGATWLSMVVLCDYASAIRS